MNNGLLVHYDAINNTGSSYNSSSTTWKDLTGNNNDGMVNNATWTADGLVFSGNSQVELPSNLMSQNFTLEAAISLTNYDELKGAINIFSNLQNGGMALMIGGGGYAYVQAWINGTYIRLASKNILELNKKYLIAGSYDGNVLKIYINGKEENSYAISGQVGIPENSTQMAIGCNPKGSTCNSSYFNGKVYSARVYNRALTEAEISDNYNLDKSRFGF